MKEVLRHFLRSEEPVTFERIGTGHIHETWLAETDAGRRYILQKVNRIVFPDVGVIMDNLSIVGAYLAGQGEDFPMIRYLDTDMGGKLYEDGLGGTWRAYPFVPNSVCLGKTESASDLFQAACAFGRFLHALRDFPAARLAEPIPDFHNTQARFMQFRAALERDADGRKDEAADEIRFVLEREERSCELQRMRERGELPLRVTHNDAKLNNVLLDADTRRALCVIDLDTVMPGLAAYDFGDLIRSGGVASEEDETDPARIALDPSRFRILVRGFLSGSPGLTENELQSLPLGAYAMTMECGLRFLTDYLDGDRYFAIDREKQNLERARSQFCLAADMERKWENMDHIVQEETST